MTDQEVLISTLREARRIIGEETIAEVRVAHVTVRSFDLIQSTQRKVS